MAGMACDLSLAINVFPRAGAPGCFELSPLPQSSVSPYKICQPSWCAKPSCLYKLEDIKNGHVYNFDGQEIVTVGRNVAATVVLPSLTVSRIHAVFLFNSHDQAFLVDLGSSHGTFVCNQQLKPFTPTLITNKSLMRFGTDGTQYLLRNFLSPSIISEEAGRIACDDERHVFLNTQYNLFQLAPSEPFALPEDLTRLSRVATVDFGSVTNNSGLQQRAQQSNIPAPAADVNKSSNGEGDNGGLLRLQLSVDVSSGEKANEPSSDLSYKRCAAEAGVGEPASTFIASPRLQRRKMSCSAMEESGMFDRGNNDRSMSIDDYAIMGQCVLHSSSSMSEEDDDCSSGSSYGGDGVRMRSKKRVKFLDEPVITAVFDGDY